MNDLKLAVYFVAVGDGALKCLELAYRSLRLSGYSEDIYIFSDRQALPFDIDNNTYLKTLGPSLLNLDINSAEPLATFDVRGFDLTKIDKIHLVDKWAIANTRTLVNDLIPTDQYSHILYLDSDIIVQGPIEILYDYIKENRKSIITSRNRTRFLGTWRNFSLLKLKRIPTATGTNLTTLELLRYWFKRPICSDIVCFPVDSTGKQFIDLWFKECKKYIYQDQSALQAVLLRNFSKEHTLAPYSLFGYGLSEKQFQKGKQNNRVDSIFVHFHGAVRDQKAMTEYYEKFIQN